MEFRLLGPVEVRVEGRNIDLGHAKQRLILAILVANAGRPVSTQDLIERVWDDDPPATAVTGLYSYVSRLRRCLHDGGPEAATMPLTSKSGSYRAEFDPFQADIHRFRALAARARESASQGHAEKAVGLFREAERLWRGQPLAGLPGRWADAIRAELEQERHAQQIERITLELKLGHHHQVIPELTSLASEYPLDERVAALLMTAYYGSGRQAAALDVYRRTRNRLSDEIGIEPAEQLRELHQGILRHDPRLSPARLEPGYPGRVKPATTWSPGGEDGSPYVETLTGNPVA